MPRLIHLARGFWEFIWSFVESWHLILDLTKRDFKTNYLGSYLSIIWAFIQPCVNILILWFVFQLAFKSPPVNGKPFILWFVTGLVPWFFLSESLITATGAIQSYNFLVKKVVFRVSLLPVIKILSALFIHLFFILLIVLFFLAYGQPLSWTAIQVVYYLFAGFVLLLGLSWITSALSVFIKDTGQIVNMLLQIGFWATPLAWNLDMMPEKYKTFMKLNPVFYVTEGYRYAFFYQEWLWEHPLWALYFWTLTGMCFFIGALLFLKLRPHFADVL